ncbi:glucosamine inositolphosphorylceramide transferase family protein [Thiothrix nivea]|uniref:Putative formyl transferase n=1 Tax=Thiothrix nivea (strain ATCC 35100 / DSM 5205 / JP2) TaxID=870187 RepID=A0A656H9F2_THINJ|nr:hypothetical protein [Thiothrix nivea]EIJ33188.1 putative formyl transferase [Thiothrix nivea DSM 5205]
MSTRVFRVGLVVNGEYISAWQRLMLERLLASGSVELVAVIAHRHVALGWVHVVNAMLLGMLHFVDGKLFKAPVSAQQPTSFLDLLGDVVFCTVGSRRYQMLLAESPLDLAIDLSGWEPLPAVMALARYGVWRHFYGALGIHSDRYMGVGAYTSSQAEILSGLERCLPGRAEPEQIFCATTSTDPVSINRGIERSLWKMADFIPQRLNEWAQVGENDFFRNARVRVQAFSSDLQIERAEPGLLLVLLVLWRYAGNFIKKFYQTLFRNEQWILLTRNAGGAGSLCTLDRFRKLIPPPDRFWADPFVVEHEKGTYVFFEELLYSRGKGHLACIRLNEDGTHSNPAKILSKPYHLSYPFIFHYQGNYYLIPETGDNRTIELYRCTAFPHRWVFEKNLMENVEAYDATLLEQDGRWWMFVSMRHHPSCSPNEALYLFHADSPLSSEWQPHPQNPVVARASQARPAGRIFSEGGQLYRPSQNCAGAYGRGLNINLIQRLDAYVYQEETVSRCMPDGEHDMHGVHTLGIGSNIAVSDAVHVRRRLGVLDRWVVKSKGFFSQPVRFQHVVLAVIPLAWLFWLEL